ncbi:divalent-cation tolerance protein CutA [Kitasatospora sp. GAS204B]|uniref:divalent-cation tolerance protein CutA n=1 Tax=unclassified Kitasatospora TaxID=2633591 RepID=UPI002472F3CF|nr:divalent-cation tolerance protein CutA [Kitasatospora sp. GAS204B]MDH6122486.1 periplasmic divalent cation tolerance protein [Kitasatospora sp. GAS204B]
MADYLQVSTATATREEAEALARSAVRARFAGSAQIIGPVGSAFWHLGEFGTGEEWQLLLKTSAERYPLLEAHLLEKHPWDNPEIVAVPIVAGSQACLSWLREATSDKENG